MAGTYEARVAQAKRNQQNAGSNNAARDPNNEYYKSLPDIYEYDPRNAMWIRTEHGYAVSQQPSDARGAPTSLEEVGQMFDGLDFNVAGMRLGDPKAIAAARLREVEAPTGISGIKGFEDFLRQAQARPHRQNPYGMSGGPADFGTRQGLTGALEQLYNGTSTVAPAAQRSFGRLAGSTSGALGGTNSALGAAMAMRAGAGAGAGLAGEAGQARLQESMSQLGAYGQGVGALRGQDLGQAMDREGSGLQTREQNDRLTQFYVTQGMNLDTAKRRAELERMKLRRRLELNQDKQNWGAVDKGVEAAGTAVKLAGGGA